MRILGLVLVTSLAVGYLAHTPARATECDATTSGPRLGRRISRSITAGRSLRSLVEVQRRRRAAAESQRGRRLCRVPC